MNIARGTMTFVMLEPEEENPGTGGNGKKLCAVLREKGYACEEWKDSIFR